MVEHIMLRIAAQMPQPGDRRAITFLHPAATAELQLIESRHPELHRVVAVTAIDVPLDAPLVRPTDVFSAKEPTLVYVCADDDAAGVEVALALKGDAHETGSRIVVCAARSGGLASVLTSGRVAADRGANGGEPLAEIAVLALATATCTSDLVRNGVTELLARAIHEDYVRERRERNEFSDEDPALAQWEDLLADFRESNRQQAEHICVKLQELDCHLVPLDATDPLQFQFSLDEVEKLARLEHERWMNERLKAGWKHGPVRDPARRTSPDLVPWTSLSEQSRDKDREAVNRIPDLAKLAGFNIHRMTARTARAS
jgi:hypothetical protein